LADLDPSGLRPSAADFRQVMGFFATGVTLLTAASGDTLRAMTANSVTSVSLDPLSLLVCVNRGAVMHSVLSESGAFAINILSKEQEQLSRACARTDSPEARLEGVPFSIGAAGAPIVDGSIGFVECKTAAALDFGTHTIFVGEVVNVDARSGDPLLFYRGQYATLS
jgi:flavin reductase (DIM6/NTAB) family NADH-FMN oxidoreductase RutF